MELIIQTENGQEVYSAIAATEALQPESAEIGIEFLKDGMMLELDETAAEAADRVKHTIELGSINGVPEVKTEMDRQCFGGGWTRFCINVPVIYRRTSKVALYADIIAPANINARIAGKIRGCATGALAVGVASAIGSPAAALPAFKATLFGCLSAAAGDLASKLVSEVKVSLYTKQTSGDWKRSS